MLLLASISDIIRVVTGSAGAIDVLADYSDIDQSTPSAPPTFGRVNLASITTAATTVAVTSPGTATVRRTVKLLSIRNTHATVSNAVTVTRFDGTLATSMLSYVLAPGDALTYNDQGWSYIPANAAFAMSGRFLGVTLLTAGNFTASALTSTVRIRGVGGGGAGGGCTSVAAAAGAAGGGGGGQYVEKSVAVIPGTVYALTYGAAGAGAAGLAGGNGGNSTAVIAGTTYTAGGGNGAVACVSAGAAAVAAGAIGGSAGATGDVLINGRPGQAGILLAVTPVGAGGAGGSGPFGTGGANLVAAGTGNAASGFGTGGGGSVTGASVATAGGAGTAGCWIVEEYS